MAKQEEIKTFTCKGSYIPTLEDDLDIIRTLSPDIRPYALLSLLQERSIPESRLLSRKEWEPPLEMRNGETLEVTIEYGDNP